MDYSKWVFGNFTLPGAMAAVGEIWGETGAEVGESRAEGVGGAERGIREVNRLSWNGGGRVCGGAVVDGCRVEGE